MRPFLEPAQGLGDRLHLELRPPTSPRRGECRTLWWPHLRPGLGLLLEDGIASVMRVILTSSREILQWPLSVCSLEYPFFKIPFKTSWAFCSLTQPPGVWLLLLFLKGLQLRRFFTSGLLAPYPRRPSVLNLMLRKYANVYMAR